MEYYYICLVLLFFFFFLLMHEVIQDVKRHYASIYIIPYCILLSLLFKFDYGIGFWGLEYEDAYSFSFCSRQFSHDIYPSSFLIDAVSIGSLEKPLAIFTYGGHFITYPTFLSIFTQILGWSPQIISIINTFTAFIILVILSLLGKRNRYWFVAPAIYCAAPIINVFTNCFLSEIFSSLLCISFVYAYLRDKNHINTCLCLLAFGLALLCKRENLALLFIPIIDSLIRLFGAKKKNILFESIAHSIPYLIIVFIYLFGCQNVFNIESIESVDIGESTFSVDNFRRLFPVFIKSLLSINTFSMTFYAYWGFVLYIWINKKIKDKILWVSLCLFSIYLILYTSHYRGYFFLKEEQVGTFETYRYINNFYYVIPLVFSSLSLGKIKTTYACVGFMLLFSLVQTFELRNNYSTLEKNMRFKEVEIVSNYIESSDKPSELICENILLYQNVCSSDFAVCAITQFDSLVFDKTTTDYYCLLPNLEYLYQRYGININLNDFKPILQLPNKDYLYLYNPQ